MRTGVGPDASGGASATIEWRLQRALPAQAAREEMHLKTPRHFESNAFGATKVPEAGSEMLAADNPLKQNSSTRFRLEPLSNVSVVCQCHFSCVADLSHMPFFWNSESCLKPALECAVNIYISHYKELPQD
jgi:hypothetical protein